MNDRQINADYRSALAVKLTRNVVRRIPNALFHVVPGEGH